MALVPILWTAGLRGEEKAGEKATKAAPWTETDTRLANHYIQLLQKDPAYGSVLDLLWDLYAKKDQSPLLLQYFKGATEKGPTVAKLIYAHLLRKGGQIEEARPWYDQVIEADPANIPALRSLAEIADLQKRTAKALSFYTRLVELIPPGDVDGIPLRLRKAALQRQQGQKEEAIATWNELLAQFPENAPLRTEIVSLLLEAGETETAIAVLSSLAAEGEVKQRLDALLELNRLYEFIGDFNGATTAARKAMTLLYFKNHEFSEVFLRLVRIHERFSRLGELEAELKGKVSETNPTEESLVLLGEFYRLTANPDREEETLKRLVERLPGELDYQIRLVNIQVQNDHYAAAAETLDALLALQKDAPLPLLLLRATIALHGENRAAASRLLSAYLESHPGNSEGVREIIDFARTNYLDDLVERLLKQQAGEPKTTRDNSVAPIELARFFQERGRKEQAVETLNEYVAAAGESTLERAARLFQVSGVFRDMDRPKEALASLDEAISLVPSNGEYQTARADLYVASKSIDEAITQLETIRASRTGYAERAEIDQRIFSLLRGHYSTEQVPPEATGVLKNGKIQTLAQYQAIAIAASQANRSKDDHPPKELLDYFEAIRREAEEKPSTESRYRAAWWAMKLQDYPECYQQLTTANQEAGKPVLEIEKMLLSLAELNERTPLMVRHLTNLIEIDPENADDLRQRRAEMRFDLGFEDEAIRELKELAAKPDASLSTLNTLAKLYQRQGSPDKQVEVWRRAYRDANLVEKRSIVKQLSNALIESGKAEAALQAQIDLLERESDPIQRRKQLDAQITVAQTHSLVDWILDQYGGLARLHPFDRFYPEALARVYKAAGRDAEAYEAMKKAYYMSGQSEELLAELGMLSDRLGDLKSAIYYRRQLLNRGEGDTLDNWKALVTMLEKDLHVGEADQLRRRLETKFGTDTEFLAELTSYYLKNGRPRDAGRTLSRLVALRSWDLEARFQLALLQIERGEEEEAYETLNLILKETEQIAYPEGFGEKILPLIRVATLTAEDRADSGEGLDAFVFTVEGYPFVGGNLQDEIAESLQKARPEFQYSPKTAPLIRIRAIEEAAALAATLGRSGTWLQGWTDEKRPLFERLWATRYAGARDPFATLLEQFPNSGSHIDELLIAYSTLLIASPERWKKWAKAESPDGDPARPRSTYGAMAMLMLLKDGRQDPLCDREAIYSMLADLPMNKTVAAHVFSELRKAGDFEVAYRVGKILADSIMADEGSFLFALSQVAGFSGHVAERKHWLDFSLSPSHARTGNRLSSHFYAALTERLGTFLTDGERRHFVQGLSLDESIAGLTETSAMERQLLLSMAVGDTDEVIQGLGPLMDRQIQVLRPGTTDADDLGNIRSQGWQRMSQILHFYAYRLTLSPKNRTDFVAVMGGNSFAAETKEPVNPQWEQFEIDRQILLLEGKNATEREALVREIAGGLVDPDSRMELAKALEGQGFHREAIPVYHEIAMGSNRDYAALQGLFDAAAEALEPAPGLEVIQKINSGQFLAPPGLTVDYLNDQHARFLLLERNVDRLALLGRPLEVGSGSPPLTGESYVPYQDSLVEVLRQTGRTDELLERVSEIRGRGKASGEQLLFGAEALGKMGKNEEALDWLAPLALNSSEPAIQRRAMLLSVEQERALAWSHKGAIRALALVSLDRQPAGVTSHLADALHESGETAEAVSVVHLLRRKNTNSSLRSAASLQILRLERLDGKEWPQLEDEVGGLFRDLFDGSESEAESGTAAYPFVEWVAANRGSAEGLSGILHRIEGRSECREFAELVSSFLEGRLRPAAFAYAADCDENTLNHFLWILPAFGSEGREIAQRLVEESGRSGSDFFRTEPQRQITFFHRIGDRDRLIEIYTHLVEESRSDLFRQSGLDAWVPTLDTRYPIPALFASLGEEDLAAGLFEAYDQVLTSYRWNHLAFLNDYGSFLIQNGDFEKAEMLLKKILRKSLRVDLRLVPRLYQAWGRLDQWESRMAEVDLTRGQSVIIRDWVSALAEGREMLDYRTSW